jgi:hypothetical protein
MKVWLRKSGNYLRDPALQSMKGRLLRGLLFLRGIMGTQVWQPLTNRILCQNNIGSHEEHKDD